jgi:hypothetical protein
MPKSIAPHLAYACLWFSTHLGFATAEELEVQEQLIDFLKSKLLYWFEALSLMGNLDVAITCLKHIDK